MFCKFNSQSCIPTPSGTYLYYGPVSQITNGYQGQPPNTSFFSLFKWCVVDVNCDLLLTPCIIRTEILLCLVVAVTFMKLRSTDSAIIVLPAHVSGTPAGRCRPRAIQHHPRRSPHNFLLLRGRVARPPRPEYVPDRYIPELLLQYSPFIWGGRRMGAAHTPPWLYGHRIYPLTDSNQCFAEEKECVVSLSEIHIQLTDVCRHSYVKPRPGTSHVPDSFHEVSNASQHEQRGHDGGIFQ